jgi:hypothetical protein
VPARVLATVMVLQAQEVNRPGIRGGS